MQDEELRSRPHHIFMLYTSSLHLYNPKRLWTHTLHVSNTITIYVPMCSWLRTAYPVFNSSAYSTKRITKYELIMNEFTYIFS